MSVSERFHEEAMQINNPLRHPHLAEHQTEAVVAASYIHGQESRIQVIMACGTGKTRVGAAIALETSPANTIVYLPSLALIRQTLPEWLRTPFPGGFEFLCVCSDQTVAAADEARVTVEELQQEFGAGRRRVTTSSEEVRVFLEAPAAMKVLFVTYHSADVVRDGLPDSLAFDLGIYDEAHRTAGKGSRFNATLQDTHTPIARRVFMTATPKHSDYSHRNNAGEAKVVFSMDDESVYGKVAYRLPIREAIHRGIITDYKILISIITDQAIAEDFAQRGLRKPDNCDKIDLGVYAMAITNAMEQYGLRKVITFHNSVNHAAAMTDPRISNFPADLTRFHMSGMQPTGERNETLTKFAAASRGLVTNARCLTEGIDVPEIDLVTFVHPKKSRVDIVQAVGRALRRSPSSNKACGYILLPLFVHEATRGAIQEKVLSESGYDAIWQTVQALREQDEMLDTAIREGVMTRSVGVLSNFIHIDGSLSQELKDFIGTVCLDELGESWDRYYGILKRIFDAGQDANVPWDTIIDEFRVGSWLSDQRKDFKVGKLSPVRIAKLEAIGILWYPLGAAWEANYDILKHLVESGQDANVHVHTIVDGLKVGIWLSAQRKALKAGKLSPERIGKLESLRIVWDRFGAAWQAYYAILKRVFDAGQDANVHVRTIVDGLKVGIWLGAQRRDFNAGKLSPERIAKLEAIRIMWDPLGATWEANYAILKRFFDAGQDANVSRETIIERLKVGLWLHNQRNVFKAGKMLPERIARLEALDIRLLNKSTNDQ